MYVGPFFFGVLLLGLFLIALVLCLAWARKIPGMRRSKRNDCNYIGPERRHVEVVEYEVDDTMENEHL